MIILSGFKGRTNFLSMIAQKYLFANCLFVYTPVYYDDVSLKLYKIKFAYSFSILNYEPL